MSTPAEGRADRDLSPSQLGDAAARVVLAREENLAPTRIAQAQAQVEAAKDRSTADTMSEVSEAVDALDSISKSSIKEVAAMSNPPQAVRAVMEAVCIIFGCQPTVTNVRGGVSVQRRVDYWPAAQKLMKDMHFLNRLRTFDRSSVSPQQLSRAEAHMAQANLSRERVAASSMAAFVLYRWAMAIIAMARAEAVLRGTAPDAASVASAQAELDAIPARLENLRLAVGAENSKSDQGSSSADQ